MKYYKHLPFLLILFLVLGIEQPLLSQKTKIACVGNSITEGFGISDSRSYPAVLQQNLGNRDYEVRNFGASGRTMLKAGKEFDGSSASYWDHERYGLALQYNPDIVIIKLGTNDAKKVNWDSPLKNEYKSDYIEMINSFKSLASNPLIYICYPFPLFGPNNWINDDKVMVNEMMPIITEVAQETNSHIIDLHTPFEDKSFLSDDKVHPNQKGYVFLAHLVAKAICPDCDIPNLPEDFFIRITDFSRMDTNISFSSSFENQDLSVLTDKQADTSLESNFIRDSWFTAEMPVLSKMTAYSITFASSDLSTAPKSWVLQGSTDNRSWRRIDEQKNISFISNETKTFSSYTNTFDGLRPYQYFRLLISENNGGEKLSIAELQMYGSPSVFDSSIMNQERGNISAQFNSIPHEGPANLIDKKVNSKYCTIVSGESWWVEYQAEKEIIISKYALTSANDAPDRDPTDWTLYGSTDGRRWEILDQQSNQMFAGRYSTMEYAVETNKSYTHFKLTFTKIGSGNMLQLAEWQLFEKEAESGLSTSDHLDYSIFTENGYIVIESNQLLPFTYSIYNTSGQCVERANTSSSKTKSLKNYESGVYIVNLHIDSYQYSARKIII